MKPNRDDWELDEEKLREMAWDTCLSILIVIAIIAVALAIETVANLPK